MLGGTNPVRNAVLWYNLWYYVSSPDGVLDKTDFDDVMLVEVWDQMDVTCKIVEEYLVPFLTEDISREPGRYYDNVPTIQDHLNKLGKNGGPV